MSWASRSNFTDSTNNLFGFVAEIRQDFTEIMAMLLRHERILSELPEAIRLKICFQPS